VPLDLTFRECLTQALQATGRFRRISQNQPSPCGDTANIPRIARWYEVFLQTTIQAASDVIPMFPTLVWKVQLDPQLHKKIDAQVLAVLARSRHRWS
jgi:hypothetical protein